MFRNKHFLLSSSNISLYTDKLFLLLPLCLYNCNLLLSSATCIFPGPSHCATPDNLPHHPQKHCPSSDLQYPKHHPQPLARSSVHWYPYTRNLHPGFPHNHLFLQQMNTARIHNRMPHPNMAFLILYCLSWYCCTVPPTGNSHTKHPY